MYTRPTFMSARGVAVAVLVVLCGVASAGPALAQSVKTKYERAQVREEATRRLKSPAVTALRSIATSYENIVRQHPRSGYSDNALWQAAGLLQLAWERGGSRADRDKAVTLLQWLRKEYPTSSLARQVPAQVAALNRSRPATARTAAPGRPAPSTAANAGRSDREEADEDAARVPRPQPMPVASGTRTSTPATAARSSATDSAPATTASRAETASPAGGDVAAAARPASPAGEAVALRGVSHTTLPRGDRITLELSREAGYSAERGGGAGPLLVALPDAAAAAAIVDAAASIRGDLIQALRVDRTASGLQLVVDLAGAPRHSVFPLFDPYRLVFDFETERPSAAGLTPQTAAAVPRPFPLFGGPDVPSVTETVAARELPAHVPAAPSITPPATVATETPPPVVQSSAVQSPARAASAAATAALPGSAVRTALPAPALPAAALPAAGAAPRSTSAPSAATRSTAPAETPAEPGEIPASTTKPAPPASTSTGGYSLARQLGLGVSRIVIDPGHGGSDPGAQANGVTESALVLDVALRLEKLLNAQPGFEVVLTRRTNAAVALARRTAIANEEQADLFLSIHANSSPRRTTAGVETYFLNFSSNEHAESVAARENASSAQDMRILPDLVRAIAMNNKLAESRELAGIVQSSLVRRLQPRNKLFQDLGVKQAPFVVLIGAQMPSVLAEIAFLTNRTESSLLKQNAYKQQIAQALCDAILKYRASLKQVSPVTVSAEGR